MAIPSRSRATLPHPLPSPRPRTRMSRAARASAVLVLPGLFLLGGCGGSGGETGEDAEMTPGAEAPAAGAFPDAAGDPDAAPRADATDSAGGTGGADPSRTDAARTGGTTPGASAAAGPDTLTGIVGTFGAEPLVHYVLQLADGRSIPLGTAGGDLRPQPDADGPLPELARLTGARVRVTGEADAFAAAPARGFAVAAYELLEVEGERPLTGRLVRGDAEAGTPDRLETDGAADRVVVGIPSGSPVTGSRVWILGTVRGDSLFVQSFGVLRPGPAR
jgi:hypothetical protein